VSACRRSGVSAYLRFRALCIWPVCRDAKKADIAHTPRRPYADTPIPFSRRFRLDLERKGVQRLLCSIPPSQSAF
jgi:hypothetical protein